MMNKVHKPADIAKTITATHMKMSALNVRDITVAIIRKKIRVGSTNININVIDTATMHGMTFANKKGIAPPGWGLSFIDDLSMLLCSILERESFVKSKKD